MAANLGSPAAVGSQNNCKYAYFPNIQRLAVSTSGSVWVYDTAEHQIGGFGQQQGSGGSITFTSQFGTVNLNQLRVVIRNGQPGQRCSQTESAGIQFTQLWHLAVHEYWRHELSDKRGRDFRCD